VSPAPETDPAPAPHTVAAAVLVRPGQVLLCHRSADRRWYPDVWDLPGGHVEGGEAPAQTLARELNEELGIVIETPQVPERARITTAEFDLWVWVIDDWTGRPVNAAPDEHDAIAWFGAGELPGLPLADERYRALLVDALTPP
jgi:8-oxo-dGTP diphosphatase